MYEQQTIVERSIERETRELLRCREDYWRAERERRGRIQQDVRESVRLRRVEDES